MGKTKGAFLSLVRVIVGILLFAYSLWLLGGFFFPQVRNYVNDFAKNYQAASFLLPDIFSRNDFLFLSLFLGTIYFLAGINSLTLKYNNRIGAMHLLFSIWIFFIFIALMKLKEGLAVGFSAEIFQSGVDDIFYVVRLLIPSCLLAFLIGGDSERL